jgi:hypothetical protein
MAETGASCVVRYLRAVVGNEDRHMLQGISEFIGFFTIIIKDSQ